MKLDRLLGILTILLQNERVTAPYLAERFEVTRRTIGRDVDSLCMAGIPIITYQGNGGGIGIAEGFKLDKSILSVEELSGIIAGLKGIGTVSDKANIEKTLDKLTINRDAVVSMCEPIVIDLASHYKGALTKKIALLKQAIHSRHLIEFDYYYEKGKVHRCIEPYLVVFQWTSWYVFGYCLEREDWRLFKLGRLWELQDTGSSYIPHDIPVDKRDFNTHLADDKKLIALFDPSLKYQLIETYGLECFKETKEGLLRFEIGYTNPSYMISWLLGFGGKVIVLSPKEIGDAIQDAAKSILDVYKKK